MTTNISDRVTMLVTGYLIHWHPQLCSAFDAQVGFQCS